MLVTKKRKKKTTIHTNLLTPLVETLALMNLELGEKPQCLGGVRSFQSRQVVTARKKEKASCTLLTIQPLFCGGALRRGLSGSDTLSDMLHYGGKAEQDQSEVTGLCLDTRSFSSERLRGTGCQDNAHTHTRTQNLIGFSVRKSAEVCAPFFLCLALSFFLFFWRSGITEGALPPLSHAFVT